MQRCEQVRGILVAKSGFQVGWLAKNRKALEPSALAPTWVHADVRTYDSNYLADRFFVKSSEEVNHSLWSNQQLRVA